MVGLWPEDLRSNLFPRNTDYSGYALDFLERHPNHTGIQVPPIPAGHELHHMDLFLFERCAGKSLYKAKYGSAEKALGKGFGLCLTNNNELVCEAFAGPSWQGMVEIGVETHEAYRHKGYAMLTCLHLINDVEKRGYQTYWNCAKDNLASVALARRLGFHSEKEYRLLAWFKQPC